MFRGRREFVFCIFLRNGIRERWIPRVRFWLSTFSAIEFAIQLRNHVRICSSRPFNIQDIVFIDSSRERSAQLCVIAKSPSKTYHRCLGNQDRGGVGDDCFADLANLAAAVSDGAK